MYFVIIIIFFISFFSTKHWSMGTPVFWPAHPNPNPNLTNTSTSYTLYNTPIMYIFTPPTLHYIHSYTSSTLTFTFYISQTYLSPLLKLHTSHQISHTHATPYTSHTTPHTTHKLNKKQKKSAGEKLAKNKNRKYWRKTNEKQ